MIDTPESPRVPDGHAAGEEPQAQPSIVEVALHGLCPACGARTLFSGWVEFAPRCTQCGLKFEAFNVGDGPAAFLTLIVGTLVVAGALVLQLRFAPPWWVHALIWLPVSVILVLVTLRWAKGALIASEYRNAAREGRLR